MKNYIKLVNFELGRFIKVYFILAAITIIAQIIGAILLANRYMRNFNHEIYTNGLTLEQFIENYGQLSMLNLVHSSWFNLPIVFAVATLLIYCFFIWYRDWWGKNTFIYRLLMLPTARINIFLSKASAIFLMVLGLVALQVILIIAESNILQMMIPSNLLSNMGIMELTENMHGGFLNLGVLFPSSIIQFFIHYGIGFMHVFILFTAILFERSYRLKGIVFGVGYTVLTLGIFFSPFIAEMLIGVNYLYVNELFILEFILGLAVIGLSIWVSNYLLNKKITV